jgi:hypothetical protein
VFLTPHIIKEAEHLAKLSDSKKTDFARAEERYSKGELLVQFKGGIQETRISEILSAEGAAVISEMKPKGLYLIKLKKEQDVREAVKKFNAYEEVEYAEPNYIMKIQ